MALPYEIFKETIKFEDIDFAHPLFENRHIMEAWQDHGCKLVQFPETLTQVVLTPPECEHDTLMEYLDKTDYEGYLGYVNISDGNNVMMVLNPEKISNVKEVNSVG